MEVVGGQVVWDVRLRQSVQDWEMDELMALLGMLYGAAALGQGEDRMV